MREHEQPPTKREAAGIHPERSVTATADSYLLLRALCDELGRCGMRHASTSPGSRSAPIVLSLVRDPRIHCWSHIDERCAGFFALGAAKASGTPVAIACTSGTAAANLAPAVIEAHEAGVPLIVLTADRPPELRDVGAGQAIDQIKLYGSAVKWFFELGNHDVTPARMRWIRTLACRAYWTAVEGRPGPVHVNVPLREPLVLGEEPLPEDPAPARGGGRPWVLRPRPTLGLPPGDFDMPPRGVVVVGGYERGPDLATAVARFAARVGYPVLADPLSGARRGRDAIATYDLLLRDSDFTERMRPDFVLRVGDLPTSKPLRAWLASLSEVPQIALDPEGVWQDPSGELAGDFATEPEAVFEAAKLVGQRDPTWLDAWRAADAAVAGAIAEVLGGELSEPVIAARLGERLPSEATLFVASSMPVRDVEEFFPARDDPPRVLSNRGANGIDGTVSAAFGAAAVSPGPVVLLIGDVALAHDIGGLMAARRLGLSLAIVLLNNDGGGIFHFLPVSREGDAFEEHVATPHGLDFAHAAALYGCAYERPADVAGLQAAVQSGIAGRGTTIIEVRTDRAANLALHRRVADSALHALRTREP
ncbi:MAG: 2-succinyl-5-enolpyruvyl-6-hydroxy-3-cyclohexene-carboxylate synthase [Solirubrobacteraceae bacterium]|jgi:2-succinyl-5-enolpyruvyl-6-hydroxy-3-cyclohexene-1-carboxylate synthase|nr:2-succinyl-5-enolpyruvyl-6-hydroxy-3-cyclohexene-carboxylate synthase [Solirubrobacteraceae bacterium]